MFTAQDKKINTVCAHKLLGPFGAKIYHPEKSQLYFLIHHVEFFYFFLFLLYFL